MKFPIQATQKERDFIVAQTIHRQAKALKNACTDALQKNSCGGCPYSMNHGCYLYKHPYEWDI